MSPKILERVTFSRSWDPRIVCAVTLTLVFLCGAAAGAVAMNLGVHSRLHQPGFGTAAGKALYFERMQRDLNLTPSQADRANGRAERVIKKAVNRRLHPRHHRLIRR